MTKDVQAVILAEANKIAAILKIPVAEVLKDLAKGKDSKLIAFLNKGDK